MDSSPLLGVLITIVDLALRFDTILIVMIALVVTAFTGELGLTSMLETLGTILVDNQGMAIFIITMLATGTLERNGLKESMATLIKRFEKISVGVIIDIHGIFRIALATFNVSFGGVADFVRPITLPMALGAIESKSLPMVLEYKEELKRMVSTMENIYWFFGQVLFVGRTGTLLVQSILKDLDYGATLGKLALAEVPVALVALISANIYLALKEKRSCKKYYGQEELK